MGLEMAACLGLTIHVQTLRDRNTIPFHHQLFIFFLFRAPISHHMHPHSPLVGARLLFKMRQRRQIDGRRMRRHSGVGPFRGLARLFAYWRKSINPGAAPSPREGQVSCARFPLFAKLPACRERVSSPVASVKYARLACTMANCETRLLDKSKCMMYA